jgi:hypothetical protein
MARFRHLSPGTGWILSEPGFGERALPATFDLPASLDEPVIAGEPFPDRRTLLRKDTVAIRSFLAKNGRSDVLSGAGTPAARSRSRVQVILLSRKRSDR